MSNNQNDFGTDVRSALSLVVLGAAAGALATILVQTIRSEQTLPGGIANATADSAREWIAKAARHLQETRDRIVESVEKTRDA